MAESSENKKIKKKRPLWVKILIGLGITLLAIVVLLLSAVTVAVCYLKPERLTPLVSKYANEYLDAEVGIDRVELSFWHTFPQFELDVRGLNIKSNALRELPDSVRVKLPAYSDSLVSIDHFNGAIDIPKLSIGEIAIYDILINKPKFNIVQTTDKVANYDIFPSSEEEEDKSSMGVMPSISFGEFEITGGMPVRYCSLPDSTEVTVNLSSTKLAGKDAPVYTMEMTGATDATIASMKIADLQFGIGGDVRWSQSEPKKVEFDKFRIKIGNIITETTAGINFENDFVVEMLKFKLPTTSFNDIVAVIPENMRGELENIKTDLALSANLQFTKPYRVGVDTIPSFNFALDIPECHGSYDRLNLNRLELQAKGEIVGDDLDKSKLDVERLVAIGDGVGFELKASVSDIITDPSVNGEFHGGVEIQRLPKKLLKKLPLTMSGSLRANSSFDFRKSYFNKTEFHRIRLTGDACLKNFHASMPELPADIYAHDVDLDLGTNSRFTRGGVKVDSLLTASLKIDTISVMVTGMDLQGRGLSMGVGCLNRASSSDTTVINPIGANIQAERLAFKSQQDSMKGRLRDASVKALLRRFKGDKRKPQLGLDVVAGSVIYADRLSLALLSDASADVTVYPQIRKLPPRLQARVDSLKQLYPVLPADSLYRLAFRGRGRHHNAVRDSAAIAEGEIIDIEVDNSLKSILRKWGANGDLNARRVGVFTRMFPVRNRISDLNVRFNTDSIIIKDTKYKAGKSDFLINGTISNISRALTSTSGRQRLMVDLDLKSDTIDVNEVSAAVFAGAAFMEKDTTGAIALVPEVADEKALQASVEASADTMAVLVIPSNIEAALNIKASNIVYSDLVFHDFTGSLNMFNGALNLNRLTANTDIGSVDLNALYNAPNRHDVSFAFGLLVKDFRVAKFLDLVPAIDSLMPLLNDIDGIINADIAATTQIDSAMNIEIPTLKAAVKLAGDSLKVIDEKTFRTIGKWLMFKHKEHNVIDKMSVEMIIDNSQLRMFPFMFDLDRYRLGVSGYNDLAMNLNYHVAVLKSPLPFKFGINITGNVDKMKIRLGRAKFNEKEMAKTVSIADTTRVNLVKEIQNVFRRGVRNSAVRKLNFGNVAKEIIEDDVKADTLSHTDSLYFIKEGLIQAPDTLKVNPQPVDKKSSSKKKK